MTHFRRIAGLALSAHCEVWQRESRFARSVVSLMALPTPIACIHGLPLP